MPALPAPVSAAVTILLSLAALAVVAVVVALAISYRTTRQLLRPVRRPPRQLPGDVGLAVEEVWIPSPRGRLAAWYLPARNGCTLICCHGINDNRGQWLEPVARLHRARGYGALLFDFAGHGESEGSEVTYGIREQADVAAVLAYLRARGDVRLNGLGIMGYSLGAITAVLAAANEPDLQSVVIESGFADVQHDIAVLFHRFTGLPSFPFAKLVVFWGQIIGHARLSDIRPAEVVGRLAPRAIFVIGDLRDGIADEPYDSDRLYARAGEPKQLWQVAGAEHVQAFSTVPDEWIERVGAFLDEHLAARVAGAGEAASEEAPLERMGDAMQEAGQTSGGAGAG